MLIVEMHRIPKPADNYDLFDCPGPLWKSLRKLGESYGWKPAGTLPASYHSSEKACIINSNMHPELNELMNGGLKRDFVRAFSTYIRRGAFGFAWDD